MMKMSMPLETGTVGIVYRIFVAGAQLRELVTVEATAAALMEALLKKTRIDTFHVSLPDQIQIQA